MFATYAKRLLGSIATESGVIPAGTGPPTRASAPVVPLMVYARNVLVLSLGVVTRNLPLGAAAMDRGNPLSKGEPVMVVSVPVVAFTERAGTPPPKSAA